MLKTVARVPRQDVPKIYCYSTPGVSYHEGWVKIGDTKRGVADRIKEQTRTAGIRWRLEWNDAAVYMDGSGLTFTDDDFRAYLDSKGVNHENGFDDDGSGIGDEWYEISPEDARKYLDEFKKAPSPAKMLAVRQYKLREEQEAAVDQAVSVAGDLSSRAAGKDGPEMLWNAKPRFGKCLSAYSFCRSVGARNILIVTNRPTVGTSWHEDYMKYIGRESGWFFVSHVPDLKDLDGVIDFPEYEDDMKSRAAQPGMVLMGLVYFVSLQDIKGSQYFGTGGYPKLKELTVIDWDVLIVDEAHEGVDTYKTNAAFNYIKRKFTLYLSGTPFKAIADGKFDDGDIYNWTYVSEQDAKERWNGEGENPYLVMPRMHMMTYRLEGIFGTRGPDVLGKYDEGSERLSMNELFLYERGRFVHDAEIDRFLDALAGDGKYPFGSPSMRENLRHTFWLMQSVGDNDVANVKALAAKLQVHPVFKDYDVIVAASKGNADELASLERSEGHYRNVMNAIKACDSGKSGKYGTITLSVRSLTTGVTVPQWTGVLMLSERNSAAEYMQASFRAQNPYVFSKVDEMLGETVVYRKTDCYVFDFNPEHTLDIVEQFANNLYSSTTGGRGTVDERRKNIEDLLKYMPVTGEGDDGKMRPFDADMVMLVPRRLRAEEVVLSGFRSNRLFQNMTCVFRAGNRVFEIVRKIPEKEAGPAPGPKGDPVPHADVDEMYVDENGDVGVPDDVVDRTRHDMFPDAGITGAKAKAVGSVREVPVNPRAGSKEKNRERKEFVKAYTGAVVGSIAGQMKAGGAQVGKATEDSILKQIRKDAEAKANELYSEYVRNAKLQEDEIRDVFDDVDDVDDSRVVDEMVSESKEDAARSLVDDAEDAIRASIDEAAGKAATMQATAEAESKRDDGIDEIKKRLRNFTRTIPSFLMAYGDVDFTLDTMDKKVDPDVFQEVAYISVDDFRELRDVHQCFDRVVFDDAVRQFLAKKAELADWFDEGSTEDIFSYIPPQRTNQIFTPRAVVVDMADKLEQVSSGCFDDGTKTFIDLYMKSGMYITEIVKRLYRSKKMKAAYPDDKARLKHIFEHQVYGLAPTEIIHKIAMAYIFGFDPDGEISRDHFKCLDSLEYAKDGTLQQKLDELFG